VYGKKSVNVQANRMANQDKSRTFAEVRERVRRLLRVGLIGKDDLHEMTLADVDSMIERADFERLP